MWMADLIFLQPCTDSKRGQSHRPGVSGKRQVFQSSITFFLFMFRPPLKDCMLLWLLNSLMLTFTNSVNKNHNMLNMYSHFYMISLNTTLDPGHPDMAKKCQLTLSIPPWWGSKQGVYLWGNGISNSRPLPAHKAPWDAAYNIWLYVNH